MAHMCLSITRCQHGRSALGSAIRDIHAQIKVPCIINFLTSEGRAQKEGRAPVESRESTCYRLSASLFTRFLPTSSIQIQTMCSMATQTERHMVEIEPIGRGGEPLLLCSPSCPPPAHFDKSYSCLVEMDHRRDPRRPIWCTIYKRKAQCLACPDKASVSPFDPPPVHQSTSPPVHQSPGTSPPVHQSTSHQSTCHQSQPHPPRPPKFMLPR
jgi:hypothetical protein